MSSKAHRNSPGGVRQPGSLKVLVPFSAVGALIGLRGQSISRLQDDTRTKIELSHRNEFYPGTTERTCLVSGTREGICLVLEAVAQAVNRNPFVESTPCVHCRTKVQYGRRQQVKLLAPNYVAAGLTCLQRRTIDEIESSSGACIQLSPASNDDDDERCITVFGDDEDCALACRMLVDWILSLQSKEGNTLNGSVRTSGSDLTGWVQSTSAAGVRGLHPAVAGDCPSTHPLSQTVDWDNFLNILQVALSNSSLSPEAIAEIRGALHTLNSYGVLDLCLQVLIREESRACYPYLRGAYDAESTSSEHQSAYDALDASSLWLTHY